MPSTRPPEDFRIPWIEEIRHRTAVAATARKPESFNDALGDIFVLVAALDRLLNGLAEIRDEPEREPVYSVPSKAAVRVRAFGRDVIGIEDYALRQAREFFGDDGGMRLIVVPGYEIRRLDGDELRAAHFMPFTASVTVRER